jgi:osmotically-inducible protein OsmY
MVVCAYLGPTVSGFGGFATWAEAQNAAPALSRSTSIAASTTQGADWIADEELRKRVKAALHNDPHLYDDAHVTVSVEKGVVILGGFVLSDWDLRGAIQTARKAAGDRQVIDNLAIKQGGHR